jgi:transcriptional regulator with XRE-family HTH domain
MSVRRDLDEARTPFIGFLRQLMKRRGRLASHLAKDIGVSHPTVGRWLDGSDSPSTLSCRKLADYAGLPLEEVLAAAGHLPRIDATPASGWPEWREYAARKYPGELDDDIINMIEGLIELRRDRRRGSQLSETAAQTAGG